MSVTAQYKYDLSPSLPDTRNYRFQLSEADIPPAHDLGPLVPPVKDQGAEGSCFGNAGASAREILAAAAGTWQQLSPAFLYYLTRVRMRTQRQDSGSNLLDGMKVLAKQGICPEGDMPYVAGDYRRAPSRAARKDALAHRIGSYAQIYDLTSLRVALAGDTPVICGIVAYDVLEQVGPDGYMAMPAPDAQPLGGHAILAVGYAADAQAPGGGWVTLLNSWGAGYAREGKVDVPYAFMANPGYLFEMWSIHA